MKIENIELKNNKFIIDGEPKIILAGEIHYYRLLKKDWQYAIDELKKAGFNAVATYIPWVIHEQKENDIDLDGKYKEQYDIVGFMKLVYENDLYFIPRPGPFVMAEMINDGIPTWVSKKYPEVIPICWEGKKATTVDLDYLNPGYLEASKKWYDNIIKEIAKYEGKNLLGIQLDNEMGMLAWVSNCPVLTDDTIKRLQIYLKEEKVDLGFDLNDFEICKENFRYPKESFSAKYHFYLLEFYRNKIKKYTELLEEWCYEIGIKNVPMLINVHGTGGGRLYGYPIGISQLYKTYKDKSNYLSGSDIYFDYLSLPKIQDTYLATAMTEAVNCKNQPLASLEFNCSDTDFGFNYGGRTLARTNNTRGRMLLAQGTKLFNFYIFTGGFNDYMNEKMNNGFDRIATTGEKHGYGAPVKPNGEENYIYEYTKMFGNTVKGLESKLASMLQKKDDLAVAFIPDYFKTEFVYPNSKIANEIADNIKLNTMDLANEVIVRYLLLSNYNFGVVNVQDLEVDINKYKTLVVNSALYMDECTQKNILEFMENGGKIILYGEVPEYNLVGEECTILKDYWQISKEDSVKIDYAAYKKVAVTPVGIGEGLPQTFVDEATPITSNLTCTPLLNIYDVNKTSALIIEDKHVIINNRYRCDIDLFDRIFTHLNIKKIINIKTEHVGTFSTLMENDKKEKILSILNLDDFSRKIDYEIYNRKFSINIDSLDTLFIPLNLKQSCYELHFANNEIVSINDDEMKFRLTDKIFKAYIKTDYEIEANIDDIKISKKDGMCIVTRDKRLYGEDFITLKIKK